jgi:hypothetical protein
VDILDEWALLPRLREFPVVVAPEQDRMSEEMVGALKTYVKNGGCLVVTGAASFARFGTEFVGATVAGEESNACYHVPAADGAVPLFSKRWLRLECTKAGEITRLGKTPLLDEQILPHPAAVLNRVGKGRVLYVPADLFRDFEKNRYPLTRAFVGELIQVLRPRWTIRVTRAPVAVDVAFRRRGSRRILHFVNRASGIPNQPNNGAIDEIPRVGPVEIVMESARAPRSVRVAFEKTPVAWRHDARRGRVHVRLDHVRIHVALIVT